MKRSYAAALLSLFVAPATGLAADLGAMPMSEPMSQAPGSFVEVGSNWYIRGDLGFSFDTAPTLTYPNILTPPPAGVAGVPNPVGYGPSTHQHGFDAGIGIGYRYNDYLRFDATYEYRTGQGSSQRNAGIVCPYAASGESSQANGNTPSFLLGYAYETNQTCDSYLSLKQHNNVGLANAYVDLGTYWGVTPYLGAGAGLNVNSATGDLTYNKTSDGTPYRADLSPTGQYPHVWVDPVTGLMINPQPNISFAPQNWDRKIAATNYSLAIALMGGVGIALGTNTTLDIGYRYLNLGTTKLSLNNGAQAVITQKNVSQDIRVGLRYVLN